MNATCNGASSDKGTEIPTGGIYTIDSDCIGLLDVVEYQNTQIYVEGELYKWNYIL